jgi:hypothetical protein
MDIKNYTGIELAVQYMNESVIHEDASVSTKIAPPAKGLVLRKVKDKFGQVSEYLIVAAAPNAIKEIPTQRKTWSPGSDGGKLQLTVGSSIPAYELQLIKFHQIPYKIERQRNSMNENKNENIDKKIVQELQDAFLTILEDSGRLESLDTVASNASSISISPRQLDVLHALNLVLSYFATSAEYALWKKHLEQIKGALKNVDLSI